MKKYLSLLLAVAAVFCISCTKELDNQNLKAPSNSHVVFKARVSNNPMSKATITPNGDDTVFSSAWEGTDAVNLYAVSTSFNEEARADWNPSTQAFEGVFISSAPTVKEEWMYEAKYPYDDDGNIPFGSVRVQKGNTYNSAYDIMYGTVNYTDAFLGQDNSGNVFVIPMTRLTGIAYFHITGGSSSDDVLSATLTVNSGNIAAETVAINGSGDAVVPTNGTNSITINFPSGYRPKANDIKLWFNVIPGEYSGLKLTINTATQTTVLNSTKTLTYTAGELNKAVLSNLKWNDKVNVYSKVTEAPTDWSGTYLIVYEDGSLAFDGSLETLDATSNTIAVTISDNKIVSDATTNASAFTIAVNDGGYSICSASGKYIGQNSDANGLATNNSPIKNTISISEDNADIVSGGAYLRYNSASNQLRFRYYKSASYTGQKAIQLYKLEDNRTDPGMSWSATTATASLNTGNIVSGFTAPTLSAGDASNISYESTNTDVATVSDDGEVTIVGPGETTIKAIFAGDASFKAVTASYTLTVTDNRDAVATPVISPDPGASVAPGTEVTITCSTSEASIYYTIDGSAPTASSTAYTGAITLTSSVTVKAIAVKDGYKDSNVASADYTVGVVNTSTEANPYSAADAAALAAELGDGTLSDVYVSGIISAITTEFSSKYNNVSFDISADGLTTSTQFRIFRAAATSADDFQVGDAVEFMGNLKWYTPSTGPAFAELDADATLIAQLKKPTFSPNGGNFTESLNVTISADNGASIYYSIDNSDPSNLYSATLNLTETTTVKAKATKGILTTGVASAIFTKVTGGTLLIDFEEEVTSYSDWTFTTIVTKQTNDNVSGHGGSYYGDTDGKTTGSIVTKSKITSPVKLTFYVSKESNNTTASSWLVKVSSDGSSWTQVGDAQSASSGITRGTWTEVVRDLSSYSNVYVKIEYSGTSAVRCIDDVSLSYN